MNLTLCSSPLQLKTSACKKTATVWKLSRSKSYTVFDAYKGTKAAISAKDVYTDKIVVQGIDSVIIPGKKNTASCLKVAPIM